jgi:hypothetical protein
MGASPRCRPAVLPRTEAPQPAVKRMPSRNQSSCSQLWFCRSYSWGRTVMAKLINELLLLTCMGGFIASATYAVTLLH